MLDELLADHVKSAGVHKETGLLPLHHVSLEAWRLFVPEAIPFTLPNPMREWEPKWGLGERLDRAVLAALKSGPLEILSSAELARELRSFNEKSGGAVPEHYRMALLAYATMLGEADLIEQARTCVMQVPPIENLREHQHEILFLCRPDFARWVDDHPGVELLWIHRICKGLPEYAIVTPHIALALHYCRERGLDPGEWLRSGMERIDRNLADSDGKPRIQMCKSDVGLVREEQRPCLRWESGIHGSGGRLNEALADALEFSVAFFPVVELISLLEGQFGLKEVKNARSKKEVANLLASPDVVIRLELQLSGDLSIREDDLEVYQMRLEQGVEWVRCLFPDFQGTSEIVVVS